LTQDRRLAAIMFTDVVGYTTMTQQNESIALRLLTQHRKVLRPIFANHRGREIKTMGDAFLIEFSSALEAVECAIEIQRTLHTIQKLRKKRLQIRIGIHVGDVVGREGDVYGDAVNIASRIERLAGGGDICISEQVYDQVRNKTPFRLSRLASQDLKNVAFPIDVYRVELPWMQHRIGSETGIGKHLVSVARKNQVRKKKIGRRTVGSIIRKLTMKDRIVMVKVTNDPEIPKALARFSEEVDYGRGETLHIVSAIETVSIVIDSTNLEKLGKIVPKKNILGVIPNLAEMVISFPEETIFAPGIVATISSELAKNEVNILEYFGSSPQSIVIIDQKDALKSYQLLQRLTSLGAAPEGPAP